MDDATTLGEEYGVALVPCALELDRVNCGLDHVGGDGRTSFENLRAWDFGRSHGLNQKREVLEV